MDSDKPVESQDREFLVSSEVSDFAYEEHHVETKDGYILVLQRVYEATAKTSKSFIPVICQHGVLRCHTKRECSTTCVGYCII